MCTPAAAWVCRYPHPAAICSHVVPRPCPVCYRGVALVQVDEISVEGVSGKEALKLWCQHKTLGYDNVDVKNFHRSWKDGLAFCALIHKHRPGIIDYSSLSKDSAAENLALAFKLAEDYFGIDRILDVEDIVDVPKPDEKIVITYVAFVFKGLAEFLRRLALAKSIGKVGGGGCRLCWRLACTWWRCRRRV